MAFKISKVKGMNWYYSSSISQFGEEVNYQVVPDKPEPQPNFTQSENLLQPIVAPSETYRVAFHKASVNKLSFDTQELTRAVNNSSDFPCVHCEGASPPQRTGLLGDVLGQTDQRGATMTCADDIFSTTEVVSSASQSSPFDQSAGGNSTEAGGSEITSGSILGYGPSECSSRREVEEDAFMILDEIGELHQELGCIDKEEMVLRDLQMVITQMTRDNRICFRDALYRLARRSQNFGESAMHLPSISFITNETLRYEGTNYIQVEDYEIDKAIVDLMFNDI